MPTKKISPAPSPLDAFTAGRATRLHDFLGCHPATRDGREGYIFRVWAPHAGAVHIMGDFNGWAEEACPMAPIGAGVWEGFVPGLDRYAAYKYAVHAADGRVLAKADPFALDRESVG